MESSRQLLSLRTQLHLGAMGAIWLLFLASSALADEGSFVAKIAKPELHVETEATDFTKARSSFCPVSSLFWR